MLRRQAFDKVGGFYARMPALQDWELWLRIAGQYEIAYIPEELSIYHEHQNERISRHPKERVEGFEYIRNKYAGYYGKDSMIRREFYRFGIYLCENAHMRLKALGYRIKSILK